MIVKACEPDGSKTPERARKRPKEGPRRPEGAQVGPKRGPRWAQDGPKKGPRWRKMGPRWDQDGATELKMEEDEAEEVDKQKCKKTIGKCRFLEGPRRPEKAKLGPRWLQDGPNLTKMRLRRELNSIMGHLS